MCEFLSGGACTHTSDGSLCVPQNVRSNIICVRSCTLKSSSIWSGLGYIIFFNKQVKGIGFVEGHII